MTFTQILPQHPGYTWVWDPTTGWGLSWSPIFRIYSPPVLHWGIRRALLPISIDVASLMGKIIGAQGWAFKEITERSGVLYIFIKNNNIEIWGSPGSIPRAFHLLKRRIAYIRTRSEAEGCGRGGQCLEEVHLESVKIGPVIEEQPRDVAGIGPQRPEEIAPHVFV